MLCRDCSHAAASAGASGGRPAVARTRAARAVPSPVGVPQPEDPAPITDAAGDPAENLDQRIEEALDRRLAPLQAALDARAEAIRLETAQTRAGVSEVAERHTELDRAQEDLTHRLADALTTSTLRFDALEERLGQLQSNIEAEAARVRSEPVTEEVAADSVRIEEQLAEGLARAAEAQSAHLRELELRVQEVVEGRMGAIEAQHGELRAAVVSSVRQLSATLDRHAQEAGTAVARVSSENVALRESHGEITSTLHTLLQRVEQLQQETVAAPARSDATASERAIVELARAQAQLDQRLTGAAEAEHGRLRDLELRLREAVDSRTGDVDLLQAEFRAALEQQAAEARSAVAGVEVISHEVRRSQEALSRGLDGVLERVEQLQQAFDAESTRARSDATASEPGKADLGALEERLSQRLDVLADRSTSAAEAESERLRGLEQQVREAIDVRTGVIEAQQAVLRATLESNIQDLRASLERYADNAVDRLGADTVDVRRSQAELAGTVDGLVERVEQLQVGLGAEAARARSDSLASEGADVEIARLKEQLDGLVDGYTSVAEAGAARLQALESSVEQLRTVLADGTTSVAEAGAARLQALESSVEQLQTALARQVQEAQSARASAEVTSDDERRSQEALRRDLEDLVPQVQQLAAQARSDATAAKQANAELATLKEQVDRLEDRTATATRMDAERLSDLEQRLEASVASRAERVEAQQVELRAALESSVDALGAALEQQAQEARSVVAGVEELRLSVDAELSRARSESAEREQVEWRWMRNDELLKERLARLAGAAEAGSQRVDAVEAAVEDWPARVEAGKTELRATLQSTVEQLEASVQRQADQIRLEHEEVRREFGSVREQLLQLTADLQAERARVEAQWPATPDSAPEVEEWELESVRRDVKEQMGQLPEALEALRRELQTAFSDAVATIQSSSAARAAEETARMEALEKAVAERNTDVSDLFEMQSALDSGMGRLASDLAAARGIATGSSLGPLRSDVHALQKQIAAQNQALLALKRSVETLRRGVPGDSSLAPKKVPPKGK